MPAQRSPSNPLNDQNTMQGRFHGAVLGLALGDALGASYEGGIAERFLWKLIGKTTASKMRWTDDTQMSIDVIESLIAHGELNQDDLALRFATSYRWSRGYGPAASKLLRKIRRGTPWNIANRSIYRDGSFGNGAAMRAPILGLFHAQDLTELDDAVAKSAIITHAHPLAIEGAQIIARATASALRGDPTPDCIACVSQIATSAAFKTRLTLAQTWLRSNERLEPQKITSNLGNDVSAAGSCITALYIALCFQSRPFLEMQQYVWKIGGDADTIGAMAGSIWGAARGTKDLPPEHLDHLEDRERLTRLATDLCQRAARST